MSKRHHATRRRSYGRRQHELHQRDDLARVADGLWLTDSPDDLDVPVERARIRPGASRWSTIGERE